MDNLLAYIKWRGDLSFEQDPFNEVDNLVLSVLCYTDFDYIVNAMDNPVEIAKVKEQFFAKYSSDDIEKERGTFRDGAKILKAIADTRRFGKTKLFGYINEVSNEDNSQFCAISYVLEDNTVYVAYRGTDASIAGWKENINMAYLYETPGQKKAKNYLNEKFANNDYKLRVGGHSKGGNFAMYASSFCNFEIQDRIMTIYNNDGPGFRSDISEYSSYNRVFDKIISILPNESIIGRILENDSKYIVIKSSKEGIWQHDAMTWEVSGNKFDYCDKLSYKSLIIDEKMTSWLEGLDNDARKEFIDALFDLLTYLQKEDVNTIDDLLKQIHEDKGKIKCNVDKLTDKQKKIIRDVKFKFLWGAVAAHTPSMFDDIKNSFLDVFSEMKRAFFVDDDVVAEVEANAKANAKAKKPDNMDDDDWLFLNTIDDEL